MKKIMIIKSILVFLFKNGYKHRKSVQKIFRILAEMNKNRKAKKVLNGSTNKKGLLSRFKKKKSTKPANAPIVTEVVDGKSVEIVSELIDNNEKEIAEVLAKLSASGVSPDQLNQLKKSLEIIHEYKKMNK